MAFKERGEYSHTWEYELGAVKVQGREIKEAEKISAFLTFPTFFSFQRRTWENLSEGCECSSQALIQNMCLLLNISVFHNNEMAHSQTKHIPGD